MKKSVLTTLVFLFSILLAVAAPVDEQSARKLAGDFLRGKMPVTRSSNTNITRAVTGVADGPDAGIYVFNSDNGFVVISADDDLPSVLAYSYGTPYDASKAPEAMKAMLSAYHHVATSACVTRTEVPTHNKINPLIKTLWDQEAPYNNLCPDLSPTGCVATATAQIMYYHKYPAAYDWDVMKTSYGGTETGDAADAVAKLMADVGEKVFMDYGYGSSSARLLDASEALRYEFGYSETTEFVKRDSYTAQSWDELLYKELASNRPVLFGAECMTPTGENGHAFIIDGYEAMDGAGYFHVNWGWGGRSDDYFLISVLNPGYQYTGGSAGSSGYSISQDAIIGIQPAETPMEKTTRFATRSCYIKEDKGIYTRSSTAVDFSPISVDFTAWNIVYPEAARQYDAAIALYKDRELIKILHWVHLKDLFGGKPLYYQSIYGISFNSLSIGKDLPNGKYQIRVLSRETDTADWTWAMQAACRYVELTIEDNTMTTATYGNSDEYTSENDFTINSVDVSGSKKVGEPLTIKINLTNNHMVANSPIFLWGNASLAEGADSYQCLGGGGCNLSPGETGEVVLEYTPQRAGDFKFILNGSSEKSSDPLYTFSETISGLYLTLKIDVDDATPVSNGLNQVDGNTFKGVVHISNMGSILYDDDITFKLAEFNIEEGKRRFVNTSTTKVIIDPLDTKDIEFNYPDLTIGYYYALIVGYNDGGSIVYMNMSNNSVSYSQFYLMTESSGLQSIKLDQPDAEVYDMRGVRQGKASDIKSLPKGVYIINKKKVVNN